MKTLPARTREAFADPLDDACIEMHHRETVVAAIDEGHVARLEDLEFLSGNCHRLVHARLRGSEKAATADTLSTG